MFVLGGVIFICVTHWTEEGVKVSGILVKRNFNYHIIDPKDLSKYTDLTMSTVTQRQSIHYGGTLAMLQHILQYTFRLWCKTLRQQGRSHPFLKYLDIGSSD